MAFIGNTNTTQAFTPAVDYFSGNGSTTAFTLSRPVASVAQVQVVIDNVAQNPSSAYTVSSNTITFTSAPLSGTNNIYVYYTSPITQVIAPGQGTVTSDSFGTITNFTTTGNTVLGDATTDTLTVGVTGIVKDSSGNVGIGVASPAAKLDVSTSTSYGGIKINGANGASINLYQPQSNASARNYQLLTNWEAWGTLDFQRSVDNATAPSVTLMSLNNAGTVVLKAGAISNSGVGIAFPATQVASSDANTLDDYEEGTWTATYGGATNTGNYTKIGNTVIVQVTLNVTGITFSTITGAPFTGNSYTPATTSRGNGTSVDITTINLGGMASSTTLTFTTSGGAAQTIVTSGTTRIDIQCTYQV